MTRLRFLRESKGVSQKDVADYINKTPQAYSLYEKGKRDPDTPTLKKLADYFHVSIDYLLEYEPTQKDHISPAESTQSRLQKKISSADPETAAELEQYLNYLESKKNMAAVANDGKK